MASSPLPPLEPDGLPQPDTPIALARTFRGYRMALRWMTVPELVAEADRLGSLLQQQAQEALTRSVLPLPPGSSSTIDQIVPRTTPSRSTPGPSPRGQAAQRSPTSPPPSPTDLLFGSRGRRLAAKLVAANAATIAHRRAR